jgi:hypothetical protein
MEGLKTPMSTIWLVIKSRTDGMGLNAATRTFEVAKNTILSWERKLSDLHRVLFLYTMVHQLIEVVIEGMDRASRFVLALDCGPKDLESLAEKCGIQVICGSIPPDVLRKSA